MADRNFYVAFAPLQGYTDCVYRRAHHDSAGGTDEYYTPFVRLEGGSMRCKDARDIDSDRNAGVPTVPQIIAKNRDEFAQLCDEVESEGWRRIDLNMGCPFPMQVKAGRGCGLLPRKEQVAEIAAEMQQRPEVAFSIKMRLGQDNAEESLQLLPIINAMPLLHVTMHPRIGRQQYKGAPDLTRFEQFVTECRQPIVYNGDLASVESVVEIMQRWPMLKGVMLGRGLLAQPWLFSDRQPIAVLKDMHRQIYDYACDVLQGDSQILARLHAFWEYQTELLDKKQYKAIMKSGSLRKYNEAVAGLFR